MTVALFLRSRGAAPPTLSYASPQSWTYGAAITTLSPTTTGATSFAVQSGALPTGVSLNTTTGDITGTPTAWAASGSVTIRATGAGGTADSSINWTQTFVPATFGTCDLMLDMELSNKWQDSARTTAVTADADPIGALDDLSGNSRHATQATAGKRWTYKTGILNTTLPVGRLDGTDDVLSVASFATFPSKRGTIFVVAKRTSAGSGCLVGTFGTGSSTPDWEFGASSGALFKPFFFYDGATSPRVEASADNTAFNVLTICRDSDTNVAFRRNGADQTGATVANNQPAANVVHIGAADSLGEFLGGDVFAVLIYQGALSAGNIALIENFYAARTAIF